MSAEVKKSRQCFAGFFEKHFAKYAAVCRGLGPYVKRARTAVASTGCEARGRFNDTRRASGDEERAFAERAEDSIHLKGHFAEPADVRTNQRPTLAARQWLRWFVQIRIVERRPRAAFAAALEHFDLVDKFRDHTRAPEPIPLKIRLAQIFNDSNASG